MAVNRPIGYASLAFHHIGGNVTGEMVNTLDVHFGEIPGPLTQDRLDMYSQLWADGPHARHCNAIVYTKVTATAHQDAEGDELMESTVGTIGGSGGTNMMPLNVAAIVQKTTGRAGRKFRGRWFFGGFALETALGGNPNELDTSFATTFQTALNTFWGDMILAGGVPVLLHQGATAPTPITSFDLRLLLGNMRMRIR